MGQVGNLEICILKSIGSQMWIVLMFENTDINNHFEEPKSYFRVDLKYLPEYKMTPLINSIYGKFKNLL